MFVSGDVCRYEEITIVVCPRQINTQVARIAEAFFVSFLHNHEQALILPSHYEPRPRKLLCLFWNVSPKLTITESPPVRATSGAEAFRTLHLSGPCLLGSKPPNPISGEIHTLVRVGNPDLVLYRQISTLQWVFFNSASKWERLPLHSRSEKPEANCSVASDM